MCASILHIPYDLDHHIAGYLDIRNYTSFSRANKHFYRHLQDESTARRCVQTSIPCSRHGLTARERRGEKSNYRKTVSRSYDRREAMRTANPYSASIVAYATSFCCDNGLLCYSTERDIRILDLNNVSSTEKVISGRLFGRSVATVGERASCLAYPRSLSVLSFGDDIVTVYCDFGAEYGQYLFAVNVAIDEPNPQRILVCERLRSASRLFVRHNAHYLYYGSHSATGTNSHHEWLIHGIDLSTSEKLTKEPLQLRGFVGSEIGVTVCFTIHDGDFYALTNQTSFESIEVDWTSYYHYIRFPLDSDKPDLNVKTIWRRQHLEGPINDAWSDLGFQVDEQTGELLIVECRKEWLGGSSSSVRTYYTEPFDKAPGHVPWNDRVTFPPNDPLSNTIGSSDNSRWEDTPKVRIDKYKHREFDGDFVGERHEYLRAKTKWIGYDFNNATFVDLVVEDVPVAGDWRPQERIKLRIVSRLLKSPIVEVDRVGSPVGGKARWEFRPPTLDKEGQVVEDGENAYTPDEVFVWPRTNHDTVNNDGLTSTADTELNEILCPGGRAGSVRAQLTDGGFIYMAGPPRQGSSSKERALIFISFDPAWGFEGMKRLDGTLARPRRSRSCSSEHYNHKINNNDKSQTLKRKKKNHHHNNSQTEYGADDEDEDEDDDEHEAHVLSKRFKDSDLDDGGSEDKSTDAAAGPSTRRAENVSKLPTTTTTNPLFWQEKAAFLSLSKGFWLR